MTRVAYAIFDDEDSATKAVDALVESNFTMGELHRVAVPPLLHGVAHAVRRAARKWAPPAA